METNVSYTIVGLFIITLLTCIIVSIIWLSSGLSSRDEFDIFQVYMKEAVTGLNLDASVEYNGVNVGTVASIKINHENPRIVELLLKVKKETPITYGTKAKLEARALTGMAYILLEDKGTDMRPLVAQAGTPYPVINTTPSLLLRLDTAVSKINESFNKLTNSIQSLLDKENLSSIKQILLSSQNAMLQLETKTIPAANQAIMNLGSVTRNLAEVSAEIQQNPTVLIRGKEPIVLGPGEK
jgi:phospholipid/cholesterol/gamma-HCH transport system substrate-binding protein